MRFLISLYGMVRARAGAKNWFSRTRPRNRNSSGASEKRGGRGPDLLRRSRLDLRRSMKLGSAIPPRGRKLRTMRGGGTKRYEGTGYEGTKVRKYGRMPLRTLVLSYSRTLVLSYSRTLVLRTPVPSYRLRK